MKMYFISVLEVIPNLTKSYYLIHLLKVLVTQKLQMQSAFCYAYFIIRSKFVRILSTWHSDLLPNLPKILKELKSSGIYGSFFLIEWFKSEKELPKENLDPFYTNPFSS